MIIIYHKEHINSLIHIMGTTKMKLWNLGTNSDTEIYNVVKSRMQLIEAYANQQKSQPF